MRRVLGRRQRAMEDTGPLEEAAASSDAVAGQPMPRAGQVFLLMPDEFGEEAPPAPARRRGSSSRAPRIAAYSAAGLLAGAGLFRLVASPPSRVSPVQTGAASRLSPLDRVADTLALVTGAFDLRVRLFHRRQMECPDLARGLILVEERWTEYNAARAANGAARDSTHTALDQSLYAGVDAAEHQFEESACPRP